MEKNNKVASASDNFRDKFCYYCHEKAQKTHCKTCFRSFHDKCVVKFSHITPSSSIIDCAFCFTLKMEAKIGQERREVLDLLKYTMKKILNIGDFKMLQYMADWKTANNVVVNPIDLDAIHRKVDNQLYQSLYEFSVDIQNVFHNCFVYYSERHEFTETAQKLHKFCELEINSMLSCTECYSNKYNHPNEWRTMVCGKPHLLLWCKLNRSTDFWPAKKGHAWWPAKLISVFGTDIQVAFFDHTEYVVISTNQCSLYSNDIPHINVDMDDIKAAMKELEIYASNVKQKYGEVNKSLPYTRFNKNLIDAHHKAMYPNYNAATSQKSKHNVDDSGIASKRPRTTNEIQSNQTASPVSVVSTLAIAPVIDADSLISEHLQCIENSVKEMSTNMMTVIDSSMNKLLNVNKQTLTQSAHSDELVAQRAKNKELDGKIHDMTMECDHLKASLDIAKAEIQLKQQRNVANLADVSKLEAKITQYENELNEANRLIAKMVAENDVILENIKFQHDHKIDEQKSQFEAALLKTRLTIEQERNRTVDELRKSLDNEMLLEKECVRKEIEKLKMEQQIQMEKQIQAAAEEKASLEKKYEMIVAGIKTAERSRLMDQCRGQMFCICGKAFKSKYFCSKECIQMWNVYKNQNQDQNKDDKTV